MRIIRFDQASAFAAGCNIILIERSGKNSQHLGFINFNGTEASGEKSCIIDAGNWKRYLNGGD